MEVDLSPIPVPASLLPLTTSLASLWTPPERLPLSQWAEKNIVLSPEYAARASNLRLYGWQRDILDSFTDPSAAEVVLMCGTQLIKTLFIQCAIAYVISEDPGPILLVEPTDTDAKDFSRERLQPMARDCTILHGKISDSIHDGTNRLQSKQFPGGNLSLVGAGAPGNLARRSIRYLFCDEIDKYKLNVKEEGDPVSLAWERTATFGSRRKRILCCSPTVQGRSRIGKAYNQSDQRKPWVPCRTCGQYQILKFFPDSGGGVKFDTSVSRERQAATCYYECLYCRAHWTDLDRWWSCERAEWRTDKPFNGVAGFWISHLYSPWKKLSEIVQAFLDAKDDRNLYQTFLNTNLAEEWREDGETPDAEALYNRREFYPHSDAAVIPQRGLLLTASVDVQESPPRLEVEIKAWGRGRENWSIGYYVLQVFAENGQPLPVTSPELWQKLDDLILKRDWLHASGRTLPILVMCIDTGSRPKPVYDFARRHPQLAYSPGTGIRLHTVRTVVPIKGSDDSLRIVSKISKEDASRKRQGVRIIHIGTICAKQEIYDTLRHVRPLPSGAPVPGCYHFPQYDMPYFDGLCAEVRIVKDNNEVTYEKRGPRNEPVDLAVYNRGGAALVGIDRFSEDRWLALEAAVTPVLPIVVRSESPASSPGLPSEGEVIDPTDHQPVVSITSPPLPTSLQPTPAAVTIPTIPAAPLSPHRTPVSRPIRGRF